MALFGGTVGGAAVELILKDTAFNSGLAKANASMKAFGSTGNSTMSKFGAAALAGFTVAATAAIAFGVASVKSFADHQVALVGLQNAMKNSPLLVGETTAAFEEQANALQSLTGIQDEEVLRADTVLARFKLTAAQLQQVTPLVLDYARATGTDVNSAAESIGKALLGNARALKAIGINFKATGDSAADFAAIVDLLTGKVGGFAKDYGETIPGKLDKLMAKFDDLKEHVGGFIYDLSTGFEETDKNVTHLLRGGIVPFNAEVLHSSTAMNEFNRLMALSGQAAGDTGAAVSGAGRNIRDALDMTQEEFKKFRLQAVQAFNTVRDSLSDLAGQSGLSAAKITQQWDKNLRDMVSMKSNMDKALSKGLPDTMIKSLVDMGAEAAPIWKAIANGNKDMVDRLVADWIMSKGVAKSTAGVIKDLGRTVEVLPNGKTIFVYANVTQAMDALNSIERKMKGTINISGSANFSQHGFEGYTHKPTVFVTSEFGQTEHVKITPNAAARGKGGGGSGTTVIVYGDINGIDDFEHKVSSAMSRVLTKALR